MLESTGGTSRRKDSRLMGHMDICAQPGRYQAWPTIAADAAGNLHLVFSGGRDAHVCPFGKIYLSTSTDGGRHWSSPRVIVDTPLDDRDPGLCVMADGTLIVSWVAAHSENYRELYPRFMKRPGIASDRRDAWARKASSITPEILRQWSPSDNVPAKDAQPQRWLGFWTMRSTDGGTTWDRPTESPVYAPHGPARLGENLVYIGMGGAFSQDAGREIGVVRSKDKGITWEHLSKIPTYPPYPGTLPGGIARLAEPHVTATPSGKLVAMARYEESGAPGQSYLWQFESEDQGVSWTPPRRTPLLGKPPHLLMLSDGRLLVSYGFRLPPFGQKACLSADEGKSWGPEIVLRDDAPNRDLGYASSAECKDGSVVTVYYQVKRDGGVPDLMLTRFRP